MRMNISYLFVCGLLVGLLSVSTEAKPLTPAQQKSLRSLLGEELSDFLASGERERRLENIRARLRLLRDLRLDTRAKGMRTMSDQPSVRKQKTGTKKGASTSKSGCFGHKMDRIGTISGMGCGP